MYKTCFECPEMKQTNERGRPLYYCGIIFKKIGKYFFIDKAGTRPKACPSLKKNRIKKEEVKKDADEKI